MVESGGKLVGRLALILSAQNNAVVLERTGPSIRCALGRRGRPTHSRRLIPCVHLFRKEPQKTEKLEEQPKSRGCQFNPPTSFHFRLPAGQGPRTRRGSVAFGSSAWRRGALGPEPFPLRLPQLPALSSCVLAFLPRPRAFAHVPGAWYLYSHCISKCSVFVSRFFFSGGNRSMRKRMLPTRDESETKVFLKV